MTHITDINQTIIQYCSRSNILALRSVNRKIQGDIDDFANEVYKIIQNQACAFPRNLLIRISEPPPSTFCMIYKLFEKGDKFCCEEHTTFSGMHLNALQKRHTAAETQALAQLKTDFSAHPALLAASDSLNALCIELLKDPALSFKPDLISILIPCISLDRTEVMKAFIASPHFQRASVADLSWYYTAAADKGSDGCLCLLRDAILISQYNNNPEILHTFELALTRAKALGQKHCIDILTPPIQYALLKDRLIATAIYAGSMILSTGINQLVFPYDCVSCVSYWSVMLLSFARSKESTIHAWTGWFLSGNSTVTVVREKNGKPIKITEIFRPPSVAFQYIGFYYLAQIGLAASTKFLEKKFPDCDMNKHLFITSVAAACITKLNNPHLNILVLAVTTSWIRRKVLFGKRR